MRETETFGPLLRRYRLAASLSQEALGERAGLSATAIAALERGRRKTPRPSTVLLLVAGLDLAPAERAALIDAAQAAFEQAKSDIEKQAKDALALTDFRRKLAPGTMVKVTRFDKPGRIVRIDAKKNLAAISRGLGQWEVSLDEVFPLPTTE